MIRRFYVHNFRCLENFELPVSARSSVLLIGKNGAGKSTVGQALRILQMIARGQNRVKDFLQPKDFSRGRSDVPMRFEIEALVGKRVFNYVLALDFPDGFKELRIVEEKLTADGSPVFLRELALVSLGINPEREAKFNLDWHLVALPIVQQRGPNDPLFVFKEWLARMIILKPIPSMMDGNSEEETLQPHPRGHDFGAWFSGLVTYAPSAYGKIDSYLKQVMPDLSEIKNPPTGKEARSLEVHFSSGEGTLLVPFADLSDGEKCFMLCAMVIAASEAYGPLVCFWDEPDNYLALSEVGHFVTGLRKAFQSGGQFITTSHNPEAIRRFSEENTLLLHRNSHLEPTVVRPLNELKVDGDLVSALIRGDLEP